MGSRSYTLHAIGAATGYSRSRLTFALQALGLADGTPRSVSEAEREAIVRYLATIPDGRKLYAIRGVKPLHGCGLRTARGVWAVGVKPAACRGCHRSDRPHRARGYCATCLRREQRQDEAGAAA
jgi:hypothetical protein